MSNTFKPTLFGTTVFNTLGKSVFYFFVFLTSFITSRQLGKSEFGEIQYIMLFVNLSWLFLNLGYPSVLARNFAQAFLGKQVAILKKLLQYTFIALSITLCCTIAVLSYIFFNNSALFPIGIILLLGALQIVLSYAQVLAQSIYAYKKIFILNTFASVVGILFLLWRLPQHGAIAYIYTFLLVNGILCIGYAFIVFKAVWALKAKEGSSFKLPPLFSLLKSSLYFGISSILATILWQRFELTLLKQYINYSDLAIYSIAFSVLALFMEPLKLATSSLLYYFASIAHNQQEASASFDRFFKHFTWFVIFIGVFIYFHAEPIVSIIYTYKYIESAIYLKILLIGMIPGTCSYAIMNMHVGLGKSKFLLIQDVLSALLFLVGLYIGVNNYGILGAAWAKSLVVLVSVSLGIWYTSFRLRFKVPYWSIIKSLIITLIIVIPFQELWESNIILLSVKGILLFSLYAILSWYSNTIDKTWVKTTLSRIIAAIRKN
jgi:O-antigen/teichoic acid export membrane protein